METDKTNRKGWKMSKKKEIKIGETVEWVKTIKRGRTVTFEKKEGEAVAFRIVRQVLVKSHGKQQWIDMEEVVK